MSGVAPWIFARPRHGRAGAATSRGHLPLLAFLLAGAGCANLLEIPDDPRLAADAPESARRREAGSRQAAGGEAESGEVASERAEPSAGGNPAGPAPASGAARSPAVLAPAAGSSGAPPREGAAEPLDAGAPPPRALPADAAPLAPVSGCVPPERQGPTGDCYLLVTPARSWSDAREVCRARGPGWELASLRSADENRFVSELGSDEAWVGASDGDDEGTWVWVDDGEPFWRGNGTGSAVGGAFENWNSDEPNGAGNSDCARLVSTDRVLTSVGPTWADLECFELRPFLCEGPPL